MFYRQKRKQHFYLILTVFILSLVGPVISITTDGYHIVDFPPTFCVSKPEILFYTVILPITVMSIISVLLKLYTFLIVIDNRFKVNHVWY